MFKILLRKIQDKWANRSNNSKREYLIAKGAHIGQGTRFNCDISSFGTEPYLIDVGEDCLFASDVQLVTHDGGVKVLNSLDYFKTQMDIIAPIKIGNNCYFGERAIVMPGVTIGNNVIVGACSIVTHDIHDNCVVAGVPARVIKDIDSYHNTAVERGRLHPTVGLSEIEKRKYFDALYLK